MDSSKSKTQKDIEYEMSRFEEEITKLIPSSSAASSSDSKSLPTSSKQKINIQMPSFLPSSLQATSNAAQKAQPKVANEAYPQQILQHSIHNPPLYPQASKAPPLPPMPPVDKPNANTAVKRDAAGNPTNKQKIVPTTAAAAATAVAAAAAETESKAKKAKEAKDKKKKKLIRAAGGQTWEDESLLTEWDPDDFRLFCGDLGNEVNDESLSRAFQKYPSFQKAKVIRDKRTGKTKGFGFVSFKNSDDFIKAMREMDGKYVGNRPIKLRKSNWRDRNLDSVKRKEMEKQKMGLR